MNPVDFAKAIPGWMKENELEYLAAVVNVPRPVTYVEVGCWAGRSASCVYLALPKNSTLICVDPYAEYNSFYQPLLADIDPKKEFLANMAKCKELRPDINFRLLEMTSTQAAKQIKDESADYVFIDADHSYCYVLQDLLAWKPKVVRNGLLMGHDYADYHDEVKRAVLEVLGWPVVLETIFAVTI